ncbi:glycosyltransferase family 2 protein [Bradyrhizobium zhanjiangense]|nr:glycosyltransferase family 2 protein [Bradyrhizobium zhanjiangense]
MTSISVAPSVSLEQCDARTNEGDRCVLGRVSILIPSYMRGEDLRTTLQHTVAQDYGDKEIIVVDDSTPTSTILDVVREFPNVTYVRTPENLGLIGARNFGAALCTGEFLLNLDDDSWLEDRLALTEIVEFMRAHPRTGVAGLNIRVPNQNYVWPVDSKSKLLRNYTGCGNVYRRGIIAAVGDYITEFHRQGEEVERSLRIMDAGYEIRSAPSIRVFHAQSVINRHPARHIAFTAANYLRRELIRAPLWLLPFGCLRALRWAVRHRNEMDRRVYISEVFGRRVPLLPFVRRYRAPVSTSTYLSALALNN